MDLPEINIAALPNIKEANVTKLLTPEQFRAMKFPHNYAFLCNVYKTMYAKNGYFNKIMHVHIPQKQQ